MKFMRIHWDSGKQVIILVILLITIGQCVDIYLPSMPAMQIALNASSVLIQLTITISMATFGGILLIYGPLSDYFGRRVVVLTGIPIFLIGSIICIFSQNIQILLIGRAIQGLGIGCAGAVAPATLRDIFSGTKLTEAISYVSMAYAIVPVAAPVLGGYLQHFFNWRAAFIVLFFYAFTVFCIYLKYFPETNRQIKQNKLGIMTIAKKYGDIAKDRRYLGFLLCFLLIFSGEIVYAINSPFIYQNKLGITPITNGWLIMSVVCGFLIGTVFTMRACKFIKNEIILVFGLLLATSAAIFMFMTLFFGKLCITNVLLPMVIYMVGAGLVYPSAIAGCMLAEADRAGMASALMSAAQIGGAGLLITFASGWHFRTDFFLAIFLVIIAIGALSAYYLLIAKFKNQIVV